MAEIMQMSPTRLLLVEDTPSDAYRIRDWLEGPGDDAFYVAHATTVAAAIPLLSQHHFQAVMLDLSLPDAQGLEALTSIQNIAPTLPIIIMSGCDDEALAISAVENGAQDYLIKDKADNASLRRALRYAIPRKRFEDSVTRQANFDTLTGLANRTLFESRLNMALARSQRANHPLGIFLLDLNSFKQVNDTLGHACGDMLLTEIGQRIASSVRPYDTAARIGGDEFAVLIEGSSGPRDYVTVAEKLIAAIAKPVTMGTKQVEVGVSIGIATSHPADGLSGEVLLRNADEAMYRAKANGASHFCFYTYDMDEALRMRLQMEKDLHRATSGGELALCYQPKQALSNGEMIGLEALVRWRHPLRGMLLPAEFLGLAEETCLLGEIDSWVITRACQDMARWQAMALPIAHVSINVSPGRFDQPDFAAFMSATMSQYHIKPEMLAIELSESMFAVRDAVRMRKIAKLAAMGVRIIIDQFGGNLSSLQSLKSGTISEIKFNPPLTQSIDTHPEDNRLVQAIIGCAHTLGLSVTASNIESESLRDCLREHLCDSMQGFIYSRPLSADALEAWLSLSSRLAPALRGKRH
jgi:diguanylate cyclase (GGDEF)-like protein